MRAVQRAISLGDLDDHELLWVMETQRSLDKPALGGLNLVLGDLYLQKFDLTRLSPGWETMA